MGTQTTNLRVRKRQSRWRKVGERREGGSWEKEKDRHTQSGSGVRLWYPKTGPIKRSSCGWLGWWPMGACGVAVPYIGVWTGVRGGRGTKLPKRWGRKWWLGGVRASWSTKRRPGSCVACRWREVGTLAGVGLKRCARVSGARYGSWGGSNGVGGVGQSRSGGIGGCTDFGALLLLRLRLLPLRWWSSILIGTGLWCHWGISYPFAFLAENFLQLFDAHSSRVSERAEGKEAFEEGVQRYRTFEKLIC